MSRLGSITTNLEREQEMLRELNTALIALEAEALGRTSDFGFSESDVSESRHKLLDFVNRLRGALAEETSPVDIQSLVSRINSGMKPLEDWREDLGSLAAQLETKGQLDDAILPVMEDILSLLDSEFTQDLRRLYAR